MPVYQLIDLDICRGRPELARFIFAQAGVKYADVRWTQVEYMRSIRCLPTGTLPILEVDGKQLTGRGPIIRFLAEEFDLAGKNAFERAKVGVIVDVLDDLFPKIAPLYEELCAEEPLKALLEECVPKYFRILEKMIVDNRSPKGWAFGTKVTYADLYICIMADEIFAKHPALAITYPNIKKIVDSVKALPKIAKWIKNRLETQRCEDE